MLDVLAEYQNGYDGVVEEMALRLDTAAFILGGVVVLRAVKVQQATETWVRIRIEFFELEDVRLRKDWLEGGGGVLYDGGTLFLSNDGEKVSLNLDPGTAWVATGARKPVESSTALLVGSGAVTIETIRAAP